ncbi:winged helix-turn-helix transcriptional regulator [Stygiolobus azoricus]|uniref:HTH domain-containing protein n=1 Tax=Stygiolobus azoricus TaxID=41675 RepID=A0A650CQL1_9CREN|nr:HTH domain-containing protein [Stygiolobus azoricus]QGR20025.1 HTH domain-containing protein [Stygiolobus azoricus]
MELTPRLQDIISILKERGTVNLKDLALELKISPKTAKGYARELYRLGFVEMDENDNLKLKNENPDSVEHLKKTVEIHGNEIALLKKEIEQLKEEITRLKKAPKK